MISDQEHCDAIFETAETLRTHINAALDDGLKVYIHIEGSYPQDRKRADAIDIEIERVLHPSEPPSE